MRCRHVRFHHARADGGGAHTVVPTRSAHGVRAYRSLADIWNMVARNAYTQLEYSPVRLGLCALLMGGSVMLAQACTAARTYGV